MINKLTAHKDMVAPADVAAAASNLDNTIRAQASPTGFGPVHAAADQVAMANNTLLATVDPKWALAKAVSQLKETGTQLDGLVKAAQEPPKGPEGESPPEPDALTPAQANSLRTGGVTQLLKVVEMLGKEEPDFDLIDGFLLGVIGTLSSLGAPT